MKRICIAALIAYISVAAVAAGKTDTRRKDLTPKQIVEKLEAAECIAGTYADSIIVSGYEKTVADKDEYFYVTNKTPFRITKLVAKFSYTATSGELLHEETYEITCDIPADATRRLSVRSWDRQHNHYYYKSRKPKRSAIPYMVSYTLLRYDVAIAVEPQS